MEDHIMAKHPEDEKSVPYEFDADGRVNLARVMSKRRETLGFRFWIVGATPLITHAWSEKAKRELLIKQSKAAKAGRDARNPEEDFQNSLYDMPNGGFGFPTMGLKNSIVSGAHKDKGVPKTVVQSALWLDAEIISVRPAMAGAICDMPLTRIYGSDPQMREDMVRVGGISKTSMLAYRAQFSVWAMRLTGHLNTSMMSLEQLVYMIQDAGEMFGIGDWRNEKKGLFGAYRIGLPDEVEQWEGFTRGGPLPTDELAAAA
jgi:hypothetical protein